MRKDAGRQRRRPGPGAFREPRRGLWAGRAGEVLRSGRVGRPLRSGRFARALRAPLRIGLLAGIVASCGDSTAPPVASELAVVGGDGQSGVVAQPLPQAVVVVVRDGAGRPISGAPVDFEVTSGGGSVLPASVTSDAQGEARAVWTLGTDIALPQRLRVTSGPASDLAEATARAGAPTTLELVDGEDQTGPAGAPLPDSLAVRVRDVFGNPVAHAVVTWAVLGGGGSVSPVQVNAGADGTARSRWTLGATAGANAARAMAGVAPSVDFEAEGFPDAAISGMVAFAGSGLAPPGPGGLAFSTVGGAAFGAVTLEGGAPEGAGFGGEAAATPSRAGRVSVLALRGGAVGAPLGGPAGGVATPSTLPAGVGSGTAVSADSVPGEWVVRMVAGAVPGAGVLPSQAGATAMAGELRSALVTNPTIASARASIEAVSPLLRALRVRVAEGEDEAAVVAGLRADPRVAGVDPVRLVHAHDRGPALAVRRASPYLDGAFYPRQSWHYGAIQLPRAWEVTEGSSAVVVAVVDDGIRFDHIALVGALTSDGYDFVRESAEPLPRCGGGTFSQTGDGDGPDPDPTIPASFSFNATFQCWTESAIGGHGLHVAGTIAARAAGVVGVAPNVRIRPVRVLGTTGTGTLWDVAQGILYAAGLPASAGEAGIVQAPTRGHVINLSLGANVEDDILALAVAQAWNAGSLLVASAGNGATSAPHIPSAYPEVISVAAVGPTFQRAPYSNFGATIDLTAPGGNTANQAFDRGIWSSYWDFDASESLIASLQGTSMAAPHVSGVAALVFAANPGITAAQVRDRLFQTARDLGAPGKDAFHGHGIVDALLAVTNHAGLPSTLRVSLLDASSGMPVVAMPAEPGGGFHFSGLAPGSYLVYAGLDDRHDGVTGRPGFLWGAHGGSAGPAVISVDGPGIRDGSMAIGYPGEAEPNGTLPAANFLPAGGYLYGTISTGADQDLYRVPIPEAGSWTFETGGVTGMCGFATEVDSWIDLLDESGTVIAQNGDLSPDDERFCSRIVRTLEAGVYYVRVRGEFASTGGYSIRVY